MSQVLVVVGQDGNQTKYIPAIRKYTGLGLSEIKQRIQSGVPVTETILFKDEDEDAMNRFGRFRKIQKQNELLDELAYGDAD